MNVDAFKTVIFSNFREQLTPKKILDKTRLRLAHNLFSNVLIFSSKK